MAAPATSPRTAFGGLVGVVTGVTTTTGCSGHGRRFSLTDGSPTVGPAVEPLPEVALTIEGDQLVLS